MSFSNLVPFLTRWLITTIAVFVAAHVIPGIQYSGAGALIGASLLLGIINALIRPFLLILSLPFILVTMGLFIFVINALLMLLVSQLIPPFQVDGFWNAFFGAIVISIVSWPLNALFRGSDGKVYTITHHTYPQQSSGVSRTREKQAQARVVDEDRPAE